MKRTLFIGCVESSYVLLECLLQHGYMPVGVVTAESSKINSDFKSLVPLAERYGLKCICAKDINDLCTISQIKEMNPEIIYCFGWSRLICKDILSIPKYGVVGFHPAALPQNRGRHPIIWALALGLKETASTFFMMDEGADTGDIVSQVTVGIEDSDNARSLYDKIMSVAKRQVLDFTENFGCGKVLRRPQNNDMSNVWRKRKKEDGQIDWRMSVRAIYNLVRALSHPYVGAHYVYNGQEIKVWKCKIVETDVYGNIEPGRVLDVGDNSYSVKAYDGVVVIIESDMVDLRKGESLA